MNTITSNPATRRVFLRYAGATALSATVLLEACKNNDSTTPAPAAAAVDLGSGDIGILNYAYALEQLEAAFYTKVVASPFSGMTAAETAILTDLRDHEIIHREFLKKALGAAAIPALTVKFDAINFGDRTSVLNTAKTFEDLGVAAYNGAGALIADTNYLLVAGKIVSVEARHAAAIRDLLSPKTASFAGNDVVSVDKGLDGAMTPTQVLPLVQPFVANTITGASLPK